MKRLFTAILFIFFAISPAFSQLSKGTMIMVYPKRPISTETYQEGDFAYFVNPSDVWQGEKNIFPKNSVFIGHVNFLKMPVQGVNGAISIKITEVVYPNGASRNINATIHHGGKAIIGGNLTHPASYNTSIHLQRGFGRGALQWVPSGEYEFGKHTTIHQNEAVFVVLDDKFIPLGY